MSVSTAKFTLEHYEHMVQAGAFDGPYRMRVELIRGEILEMSPIGYPHASVVNQLNEWSILSVDLSKVVVASQNPIRIPQSESEPEPDLLWARRCHRVHHPEPQDVLLLVEVADSSLEMDRGEKLALYAEAGIQDYWIVNLIDKQVEVYRDPQGQAYTSKQVFAAGQAGPNPLAAPGVCLSLGELFA